MSLASFYRTSIFVDFSLFMCATLCFAWAFDAEFAFDDHEAIVKNPDMSDDCDMLNLFKSDFWGTKLTLNSSHKSYRPLAVMLFRFLKIVNQGKLSSRMFHTVNIISHGVVCVLLHHILIHVCEVYQLCKNHSRNTDLNISFMGSLLFAVHPIHSEIVCAAVGLADLISTVFALISLHIFLTWKASNLKGTFLNATITLLLSTVSMLFKEHGITILGICCALETMKFSRKELSYSKLTWLRISLMMFGCALIILCRCYIMDFKTPTFHEVDNPAAFLQAPLLRFINYNYVYALNLWIIIHPWWLCFDWSMGCVPVITSFFDQRLLAVFLFWTFLSTFVYKSLLASDLITRRRFRLCLIFTLVSFIPSSNLFFTVGFVIAERSLYVPSIGICLLVVMGFQHLNTCTNSKYERHINAIFYYVIVIFTIRTVRRTVDWSTEANLFKSGLNVCPLNAKVHYNIAKVAAEDGDKMLAIKEYEAAIELNPRYYFAMNNLANIFKDMNQSVAAERLLRTAVGLKPDFSAAWMNLGIVLSSTKKFHDAEYSYLMALKFRKNYSDCLFNLGNLYLEQKRYNEAMSFWKKTVLIKPNLSAAWNNMALLMDTLGNHEKAVEIVEQALEYIKDDSTLHFIYANVLGKLKRFEEAEQQYKIALSLKQDALYFANLGVLYHLWKRFDDAKTAYQNALSFDSSLQTTKDNLNILLTNQMNVS